MVDCDDKNVCTDDSCDPATGCLNGANAIACDDGSACTTGDTCADKACVGDGLDCDDGNVCTDDSCSPATGCVNAANTIACDDDSECTADDTCADKACVGSVVDCDDKNVCTDDGCDPATGCVNAQNTVACDDGSECTADDTCADKACVGDALDCNDGNVCTEDSCDVATGCVNAANAVACDDGSACTADDVCADKACAGSPVSCDDQNPCTDDSCDTQSGCVNTANAVACDDGSACTSDDVCTAKACVGAPIPCDDGNACTDNGCDPATGCTTADNTAECDDGDACTTADVCAGGSCAGEAVVCDDANPCTADSCQSGECQYLPDDDVTASCYAGAPETEGVGACKAGVQACVGGVLQACEGAVLPAVEICANGADDDCDGTIDEPACAAEDLQLALAEVDFSVGPGSPGFLVGAPEAQGAGVFTQGLTALDTHGPGKGGDVLATVGPLSATASFNAQTLPGAEVALIVRQPDRWRDDRTVVGVVQVRDARGQSRVAPTTVTLRITTAGKPDVLGTCTTGLQGICEVSATVPKSWFGESDLAAAATAELSGAATPPQPLTLHGSPAPAPSADPGVHLELPLGPRLRGTTFAVPIIATSTDWPVEAFDVSLADDAAVLAVTQVTLHEAFDGATNASEAGAVKLVAVKQAATSGTTYVLASVTFQVKPDAPDGATGAIGGTIQDLLTVQNAPLVPTGTAVQGAGALVVASDPVRGIMGVAGRAQLYDRTALGTPTTTAIAVFAVHAQGPDAGITGDSVCAGAPDCLFDAATADAGPKTVDITYDTATTTVPLTVWKPELPLTIEVADPALAPIAGWVEPDCTTPVLQSSRVWATTTFSDGASNMAARVPVTLQAADEAIAVVEGGRVVGVSDGETVVQAIGPLGLIGETAIVVGGEPVSVTGLDVVVLTSISTLPIGAAPDGSPYGERPMTASVHQVLTAEGAMGHVLTWATLSDGTRAAVGPSDGLLLSSNAPDALGVTTDPPQVTALLTADGALVAASWSVCEAELATGAGVVSITLPDASSAAVALSEPRVAFDAADPAAAAGVAVDAEVTVTLSYEDGTDADFTLDERTVYDDVTGDPMDLFELSVGADGITVVPTGAGVGTATLGVSFTHAAVTAEVTVSIVKHEGFALDAHPWPAYAGSTAVSKTTLKQLEGTGSYQQAVLSLQTILTDGFEIDLSAHAGTGYGVAGAAVAVVAKNKVSAQAPGTAEITATFAGASSAPLTMTTTNDAALVSALTTSFPTTFSGIADVATAQLTVSATFDDGTVLADATAIAGLLSYESSDPDKASIDADGLATLHHNHNQPVTLTANAQVATASSVTACNLVPVVGDVDLGQTVGVPHPDVGPGELFTMPVRVNTGGKALGSLDVTIAYDPDVIQAVSGGPGPDWPGGQLEITLDDPPGEVHIVAAASAGTSAAGTALRVVDLEFKGLKDDKKVTLVGGHITKLLENTTEQEAIGPPLGPGETRPILAGSGLLDPDCADGSDPWDHTGNANGDCEFSVGDVSFTLFYLAGLVQPTALEPFQLDEMDADTNGTVDVADAVYMLRVLAGKFRFAIIEATDPTGLNGTLTLTATLTDQAGDPVDAQTQVWFELGTTLNADMTVTTGSFQEATASGILVAAQPQGDGVYVVQATGFVAEESDVGVVAIIESADGLGKTSADRIIALHGTPWLNDLLDFEPAATFGIVKLPGDCIEDADCDDANVCTAGDSCVDGTCVPGPPLGCDDGNACTDDSCVATTGCVSTPNAVPCDDGDACTVADTCADGTCVAGAPPECDDGNPCTDDDCDSGSGCTQLANTAICDDGDACTTADACADSACVGGAPAECDDGNACTDDACKATTGCTNTANTATCDDGDACTAGDTCSEGGCAGEAPVVCDDGNACTDDACDPVTGCTSAPNTAPCDDGDACTTADACVAGACVGGPAPPCDDDNECTDDVCDAATGCQSTANASPCDDGNACTVSDVCAAGACTGSGAPVCDDGNPCTDDTCDGASGCVSANNTSPCDDGDACTSGDSCAAGICTAGIATECDDGNPCSTDSCNPETGCQHELTAGCCKTDAHCDDSQACTVDSCDVPSGDCTNDAAAAEGQPCDDGEACTSGDACASGECSAGEPVSCDDGDACTDDACDGATGECTHAPVDSPDCKKDCWPVMSDTTCSGGNLHWVDACGTMGDVAIDCDDGDKCTLDTCDPAAKACVHDPEGGTACAGDLCDGPESLVCQGGHVMKTDACGVAVSVATSCDDADVCTKDVCDASAPACAHTETPQCSATCDLPIGLVCEGDNLQWLDACGDIFAMAENCDDGDATTLDSCDSDLLVCLHTQQATPDPGPEPTVAEEESDAGTAAEAGPDAPPTTGSGGETGSDSGCQTGAPAPVRWWLVLFALAMLAVLPRRRRS